MNYIQQLLFLRGIERRNFNAFGLNSFPVFTRAEHQLADLVIQDRLLLLLRTERIDQSKSLIIFTTQRSHRFAVEFERSRLRGGKLGVRTLLLPTIVRLIAR